jgi:hypothetical protein
MKGLRIESHLPAISFELEGKFWIACGAQWIEVDRVYTPKELQKIWVKTKPKYSVNTVTSKPAKTIIHKVKGSKGVTYKVKQNGDSFVCNCPASTFRRWEECKHIKEIKNKF